MVDPDAARRRSRPGERPVVFRSAGATMADWNDRHCVRTLLPRPAIGYPGRHGRWRSTFAGSAPRRPATGPVAGGALVTVVLPARGGPQSGAPRRPDRRDDQHPPSEDTIAAQSGLGASIILHASTVSLCGCGILIEGKSGSGKSSLALSLMALGAELVADDRTQIRDGGKAGLIASAPPGLPHAIEARGVGLLPATLRDEARLGLVIDMDQQETARLPEPRQRVILRQNVPYLHNSGTPHFTAAVVQYVKGLKGQDGD